MENNQDLIYKNKIINYKYNDFNIDDKVNSPKKLYDKTTSGKILYIRHGQTSYNKDSVSLTKKIKAMPDYIDCHLTEKGINQAEKAAKIFLNMNVDTVYISPLFRALETVTLFFKENPKKNEIKFFVHPYLIECISGVHDFVYDIKKTKEVFNINSEVKIDWTIFDHIYQNDFEQNTFYMDYANDLDINKKQEVMNNLKEHFGKDDFKNEVAKIGQLILDLNINRIESIKHLWSRGFKIKEFIKDNHKETLKDTNKKILIIGHSSLGKVLTSKLLYQSKNPKEYPKDCLIMKNCEIISLY